MNAYDDLDRRLAATLEDGPSRVPERSIDAALAHAHAHPRRRDPLAILRRDPMNTQSSRFAVALQPLSLVVILALVLAAGLAVATAGGVFQDRSVVVPPVATPSPTPSQAPSGSTPASSSLSPSSPTAVSVDLIENGGADATIDIIDLSGTLVGAVSGSPGDGITDPVLVTGLPANPASISLRWNSLPCDTTHLLTIEPDGLTMAIEHPACEGDAPGQSFALVLTFDHPVDPSLVKATIRITGS
jgi:hypothetical protein